MASDPAHWDGIYGSKHSNELSWYEAYPELSLSLVAGTGVTLDDAILDVGGGASSFVDQLLDRGFTHVTVLDLSDIALSSTRARLGTRAASVRFVTGNVLWADLGGPFAIWHDRAVFHFLTSPTDQERYVARAREHVLLGGHLVIATFADDGPEQCSGLPVARYSEAALAVRFSEGFEAVSSTRYTHKTPRGTEQRFVFGVFRRR